MNLTPAQAKLAKSVEGILTRADHHTVERINRETRQNSARINEIRSAGWPLEDARIAGECIDDVLPLIFTAYNAERSRLWFNTSSLNFIVRQGIERYYERMGRLRSVGNEHFPAALHAGILQSALNDRKRLTVDAAEEHFRHPGIGGPLQRHPVAALLATNIITFVLTIAGRALVP